jgi:hypothetical protein
MSAFECNCIKLLVRRMPLKMSLSVILLLLRSLLDVCLVFLSIFLLLCVRRSQVRLHLKCSQDIIASDVLKMTSS